LTLWRVGNIVEPLQHWQGKGMTLPRTTVKSPARRHVVGVAVIIGVAII
jgi:hypothetical protein